MRADSVDRVDSVDSMDRADRVEGSRRLDRKNDGQDGQEGLYKRWWPGPIRWMKRNHNQQSFALKQVILQATKLRIYENQHQLL